VDFVIEKAANKPTITVPNSKRQNINTATSSMSTSAAGEAQLNKSFTATTTTTTTTVSTAKVKVHFLAVGSAPILKKTKFQVSRDQRFGSVQTFLRKVLKLQNGESLFLYLQSAFCPGPDELVGDLDACFSKRGELVIHYSLQQAWG
jgi:ubiquitin-like protein ATG12